MPKIITAFDTKLSIDDDGHLTRSSLLEKNWVGVPFTNQQELFSFGNKHLRDESGVVSNFIKQFQNLDKLKSIRLDDGRYNSADIPNEETALRSFIEENFIINFLIVDNNFSWAYTHDNYYDAFILYSTSDSFLKAFECDYKVLQRKYLEFWSHPDSELDEIETAEYIYSKYAR